MATSKAQLNSAYNDTSFIGDLMEQRDYVSHPGITYEQARDRAIARRAKVNTKSLPTVSADGTINVDGFKDDTKEAPKETAKDQTAGVLKAEFEKESNAQAAVAAGNFVVDVLNANAAYNTAIGQAAQNITSARNQKADTLFLGRQAQLQAQSEGYNAGQDATLAMAAQGQDVNGSAVGKIQGSFEAMGIEAGSRQYQNAIREALGYDIEEINTNAQMKAAKAARNAAIIGSALTNGTKAAMAMA